MLIDTHCHVQMRQFAADRETVIAAAYANGIGRLIVPGTDVETSRAAIELAQQHAGRIFAGVGTHPHDASTLTSEALAEQRTLAQQPSIVAIGEIGLDFYRNLSPRDVQRDALVAQVTLARELDLPVILHNRESHEEMISLLRAHAAGVRGVFHCFIGRSRHGDRCARSGILSFVCRAVDVSAQRRAARCRRMGACGSHPGRDR